MSEYDSEYLVLTHAEKVRETERNSWAEMRDTLRAVRDAGTEAMGEITADVSNACMDVVSWNF